MPKARSVSESRKKVVRGPALVLSFPEPKPKTTLNPDQQHRIRLLVEEGERQLETSVEMIARYKALLGDTQEVAPQETPAKRRPAQEASLISSTFAKFQAERARSGPHVG